MPRNSSGTYTLPAGNPVVTGTTISSTWANTTLSDISSEMTDSLDRSGKGGMLAPLQLADGTAPLPALTFVLDSNTGLCRIGSDNIGLATGGSLRFDVSTTAVNVTLPLVIQNGLVGSPAVTFTSDTNTGFYLIGADDLGFVTGGILRYEIGATGTHTFATPSAGRTLVAGALNGQATVAATGTLSGGTVFILAENLSNTASSIARFTASVAGSSAGSPDYRLNISGSQDWFLRADNAVNDQFALVSNATTVLAVTVNGEIQHLDGTTLLPSVSFISDPDTGFYRDTANQIAIALGGAAAGQIAQGSFTVTYVGGTTAPTGTAEYQRIGNHVILFLPGLSATSNSNSFSFSGLPAIIQCPSGSGEFYIGSVINAGSSAATATAQLTAASGSITFLLNGSATGWNAAGVKALSTSNVVCMYKVR